MRDPKTPLEKKLEAWVSMARRARERREAIEASEGRPPPPPPPAADRDPVADAMTDAVFDVEQAAGRTADRLLKLMRDLQRDIDDAYEECHHVLSVAANLLNDIARIGKEAETARAVLAERAVIGFRVLTWTSDNGDGVDQALQVWTGRQWRLVPTKRVPRKPRFLDEFHDAPPENPDHPADEPPA